MKNFTKILLTCATMAIALCSCSKELTVNPQSLTLYSEGTAQLETNAKDATFTSGDEFYAEVDAFGKVTANKVGKTEILVKGNGSSISVPITICSRYTLYPNLDAYIGQSKSTISSAFGTDYTISEISGKTTWLYTNYNTYVTGMGFSFNGNIVESITLFIPTSYTSMETNYLLERYAVAGMQNDYYFFLNHDKNVVIALTVYNASYLAVVYMAYDNSKSASPIDKINDILTEFNIE